MSVQSLEAERQAILDRIHSRRENYRRILHDGATLDKQPEMHAPHHQESSPIYAHSYQPMHQHLDSGFPRSTAMRMLMDHPLLVAAGVAAVVLIGPRRIMKTVATATATAGALTANNQSNMDMLGRLLTMAGAYAQGRSNTK